MISEVYDAFIAAGAPDKARKAAEALANEPSVRSVEREILKVQAEQVLWWGS